MKSALIFVLLLVLKSQAFATCTFIQGAAPTSCGNSSTCAVTISATGTGNLLVGWATANSGVETITSVAGGGTWTVPGGTTCRLTGAGQGGIDCAYTLASTSGATTVTFTMGGTANHLLGAVGEYSCTGAITFDVAGTGSGSSQTNPAGVALTLNGTNDIIVQGIGSSANVTAINGAYTNPAVFTNTDASQKTGFGGAINTASGTAPTWTCTSCTNVKMAIAFKEAAITDPGITSLPGLQGSQNIRGFTGRGM